MKRCEDGYKLCDDLIQMIAERAELEKAYSESLKSWSKNWKDHLQKSNEYGTIKSAWASSFNEADQLSEIHLLTYNSLFDELITEIKNWQKQKYPKSITNELKTAKKYEAEFKKVIFKLTFKFSQKSRMSFINRKSHSPIF